MKREHTFSMRMSKVMRDDLEKIAKERRSSIASLLETIISEYLAKMEGGTEVPFCAERREQPRAKITLPCSTNSMVDSDGSEIRCVLLNISLGGALITYAKGSQVVALTLDELSRFELCFEVPSCNEKLGIECVTHRITDTGAEIQVGASFNGTIDGDIANLASWLSLYC